MPMLQQLWMSPDRINVVCVDSYDNGVLQGRFYNSGGQAESFSSMTQFLLKMEELLDREQMPQAYTETRTFSEFLRPEEDAPVFFGNRRGTRATFELKIIFRQHTSWQGTILWKEGKQEYSFRSVLELVFLMDSALRHV